MDTTADALSPRMVKTYLGFWSRRLLHRRWPLQTCRPPAGQKSLRVGKLNSPECKSDHPVSQEEAAAPGHQQEQETPNGPSVDQLESIQGKIGPRSKTLADDKAKSDAERGLEEVAAAQDKVLGVRTQARIEAETSSQWPPNRTVRF
jgi:hypothetical protein